MVDRQLVDIDTAYIIKGMVSLSIDFLNGRISYSKFDKRWDKCTLSEWAPRYYGKHWPKHGSVDTTALISLTNCIHIIIGAFRNIPINIPIVKYNDYSSFNKQVNVYLAGLKRVHEQGNEGLRGRLINALARLLGKVRDKSKRAKKEIRKKDVLSEAVKRFRNPIDYPECDVCGERTSEENPLVRRCPDNPNCCGKMVYCSTCLRKWVCANNSCPLCRATPCVDPNIGSPDPPGFRLGDEVLARTPVGIWYKAEVCGYEPHTNSYQVKFLENYVGTFQQEATHISSYNIDHLTGNLIHHEDVDTVYGSRQVNKVYGVSIMHMDELGEPGIVIQDGPDTEILEREGGLPIWDQDL
jgi:hypothetical protein